MNGSGAATNVGRRDGDNEDSFGTMPDRGVWFVADGVGGNGHGAIASGIVRKILLDQATPDTLLQSIRAAHQSILDAEAVDPGLRNMASTVVVSALSGSHCRVAWVGDSRAYLLRAGKLAQLTVDHSIRQLVLAQGDGAQTLMDEYLNPDALVRALGMELFEPSVRDVPLRKGDQLLLCSDGLYKEVSDDDIATILSRNPAPQAAADALVSQALANGGRDNVSVVVIAHRERTARELGFGGLPTNVLLPLAGGMLLALAGAAAWLFFS